jgi:hypothetical protein
VARVGTGLGATIVFIVCPAIAGQIAGLLMLLEIWLFEPKGMSVAFWLGVLTLPVMWFLFFRWNLRD